MGMYCYSKWSVCLSVRLYVDVPVGIYVGLVRK